MLVGNEFYTSMIRTEK